MVSIKNFIDDSYILKNSFQNLLKSNSDLDPYDVDVRGLKFFIDIIDTFICMLKSIAEWRFAGKLCCLHYKYFSMYSILDVLD